MRNMYTTLLQHCRAAVESRFSVCCEFPLENLYTWHGGRDTPLVIQFRSADDLNILWSRLRVRLGRAMVDSLNSDWH